MNRLRSAGFKGINRLLRRRGYEALPVALGRSRLSPGTGLLLGLSFVLGRRIDLAIVGAGCEPNSSLDAGTGFIAHHPERVSAALLVEPVGRRLANTVARVGGAGDFRLSTSASIVGTASGEESEIWTVDEWASARLNGGGADWASSNRDHVAGILAESLRIPLGRARRHVVPVRTPVSSLTELLIESSMDNLDYLQVDVEGYDDQVLFSLDFSRYRPLIVRFEFVHLEADRLATVDRFLSTHGYVHELDEDLDRLYRVSPFRGAPSGG